MSIWWVSAPSETRLTAVIEAASGVCTLIGEPYEAVDGTDVIVGRGEDKVIRKLANNASAKFSEAGYSGMIAHADGNDELTEILGLRLDLPVRFLRDLLLIPCKAVGLDWMVVESILRHRPVVPKIDDRTVWQAHREYGRLSLETAQRTVRFWQLHNRIEKVG